MLRAGVQRITNSDLTDLQWLQASLPVKDGCLGVRRVSLLAVPALLALAASTLSRQKDVLSHCDCSDYACPCLQNCLSVWSSAFGTNPDPLPPKQPFWDHPGFMAVKKLGVVQSKLTISLFHNYMHILKNI